MGAPVRAHLAIGLTLLARPPPRAQMCDTLPASFLWPKMATILCPPRGHEICFNLVARIIEQRINQQRANDAHHLCLQLRLGGGRIAAAASTAVPTAAPRRRLLEAATIAGTCEN